MTERMKDGSTRVFMRDGTSFGIKLTEYGRIVADWKSGATFIETIGVYGNPVTIKLAEVNGIGLITPYAFAASIEDDRLTEQEDKARDITS